MTPDSSTPSDGRIALERAAVEVEAPLCARSVRGEDQVAAVAGARAIGERLGSAGIGIEMNVADDASVSAGLEQLTAELGDPLVLVNNAGITRDNLLVRMKPEEWNDVLETNLTGTYRLCRQLLRPMMQARWGRIINLSSVVARMANGGQTNYAATKAAIEGFTRALAQEVGSRGITVNAVAPGFIETEMTAQLGEEVRSALLARVPMGRLGSVEVVAALVGFLASDAAGYITAETIAINGGLYSG